MQNFFSPTSSAAWMLSTSGIADCANASNRGGGPECTSIQFLGLIFLFTYLATRFFHVFMSFRPFILFIMSSFSKPVVYSSIMSIQAISVSVFLTVFQAQLSCLRIQVWLLFSTSQVYFFQNIPFKIWRFPSSRPSTFTSATN